MSKKSILKESTVRRFMKLADIDSFTNDFVTTGLEEAEEAEELEETDDPVEEGLETQGGNKHKGPAHSDHKMTSAKGAPKGSLAENEEDEMEVELGAPEDLPVDDLGDVPEGPPAEEGDDRESRFVSAVQELADLAGLDVDVAGEEGVGDEMAPDLPDAPAGPLDDEPPPDELAEETDDLTNSKLNDLVNELTSKVAKRILNSKK